MSEFVGCHVADAYIALLPIRMQFEIQIVIEHHIRFQDDVVLYPGIDAGGPSTWQCAAIGDHISIISNVGVLSCGTCVIEIKIYLLSGVLGFGPRRGRHVHIGG